MEKRKPKKTDQKQINKALNILKDCIATHTKIESTLCYGAFCSILIEGYIAAGMNYEEFTTEWDKVKHHYKHWFFI